MAVYCGSMKEWRILNINTGTVYSSNFPTKEAAEAAIEDGQIRGGLTVKRVTLNQTFTALRNQNA